VKRSSSEIDMKANGSMGKDMDLEFSTTLMVVDMKESGWIT
jgi:hypothetical protein